MALRLRRGGGTSASASIFSILSSMRSNASSAPEEDVLESMSLILVDTCSCGVRVRANARSNPAYHRSLGPFYPIVTCQPLARGKRIFKLKQGAHQRTRSHLGGLGARFQLILLGPGFCDLGLKLQQSAQHTLMKC